MVMSWLGQDPGLVSQVFPGSGNLPGFQTIIFLLPRPSTEVFFFFFQYTILIKDEGGRDMWLSGRVPD